MRMQRSIAVVYSAAVLLWPWATASADQRDDVTRFEAQVAAQYPDTPSLVASEFLARDDHGDFVIVDVREAAEQAVSRIPGAIDGDALPASADLAGRPLLVYCTIGMRSAQATDALRKRGYRAYNLIGGVLAWAQAGQEFVDTGGMPTRTVHVYGRSWNRLPPDYVGVW